MRRDLRVREHGARSPARRNLFQAVANNLTLRGFRASAYLHRQPEASASSARWLARAGSPTSETIVDGLEHAPEALMRMLAGDTTGKTLVRVS